jgi:hypothetical protein
MTDPIAPDLTPWVRPIHQRHPAAPTCPVCGQPARRKYRGGRTYRRVDGTKMSYVRWKCKLSCGSEWTVKNGEILLPSLIAPQAQPWAIERIQSIRAGGPHFSSPPADPPDTPSEP